MGAEERVVLVVEDEPLVRENIADELRTYGWHVLEAASGEDALSLTADNQFDVVFLDILLPGQMSGWEIAEALRAKSPPCQSSTRPVMAAILRGKSPAAFSSANLTHQASSSRHATISWLSRTYAEQAEQVTNGITTPTPAAAQSSSPGLRLSQDKWSSFVSMGLPIFDDLNGIQSEPNLADAPTGAALILKTAALLRHGRGTAPVRWLRKCAGERGL